MESNSSTQGPIQAHLVKDILTAVAILALGLILLAFGANTLTVFPVVLPLAPDALHWWHILLLLLVSAATCWQSRYPLTVFFVITAGLALDMALGLHLGVLLAWANSVYNAGRYTTGRVLRWFLLPFGVAVFGWIFALSGDAAAGLSGMLQIAFTAIVSLWWGVEVRGGDTRAEAERLKSLEARRREHVEREALLRRHRADLAAQLHDTISSHLSTIALYTTGALEGRQNPDQQRQVLTEIRRSSLDALTDMRELIDVLRTFRAQEASADTLPSTSSPTDIFARLQSAGLQLTLTGNTQDLYTHRYKILSQERAALLEQVMQESLTNALKHGDSTATLSLEHSNGWLGCTISNPMVAFEQHKTTFRETAGFTGGLGLGTMAGAVHKLGGRFTAGVTADDDVQHWMIEVTLPALHHAGDASEGRIEP